jgi:hypothetical protein
VGVLLGISAFCALALGTFMPSGSYEIQEALDHLVDGKLEEAELLGLAAACRRVDPSPQGWLVAASARERSSRYASAVEAYRSFLSLCADEQLRAFASGRIERCNVQLAPPMLQLAPSRSLRPAQRRALAVTGPEVLVESSDHFVVRARNASLARLVADQAERALRRICADLLGGRDYPHSGMGGGKLQPDRSRRRAGPANRPHPER